MAKRIEPEHASRDEHGKNSPENFRDEVLKVWQNEVCYIGCVWIVGGYGWRTNTTPASFGVPIPFQPGETLCCRYVEVM